MNKPQRLTDRYGPYMTLENLASVTHSSKQTIYNKIYDDSLGIPFWRLGKKYLFSTEYVEDFIDKQLLASVGKSELQSIVDKP